MVVASVGALWTVSTYVNHIPLATYGAWLATGNILAWATLVDPGLGMVVQQKVAEAFGNGDHQRVGNLAITGTLIGAIISFAVFTVCAVLILTLPWILGGELPQGGEIQQACWVAAIGSTLTVASYSVTGVLLGLQVSISIGLVHLLSLIASLVGQIWLVKNGWGPMGIAVGAMIRGITGLVCNAILMTLHLRRLKSPFNPTREASREIGRSISYTFVSRLVGTISTNLDSLIITRMIGAESAPVLRSSRAAVDISIGLVNRPAAAVSPVISHIHGAGEFASKATSICRFFQLSAWISTLAAGGIFCLNESFVSIWVGSQLYAGFAANAWFALWLVISSMMALFSNVLTALGCFKETSLISTVQAVLSTIACVLLAKIYGMEGIPLALTLSSVIAMLWYFYVGVKSQHIPVVLRNSLIKELWLGLIGSTCAAWIITSQQANAKNWQMFIVHAILYVAVFSSLLILLSKEFRHFVFGGINKILIQKNRQNRH